jgi:hypothetical protein
MPLTHQHPPGVFDPGHCHTCAREADLLDHYWQVQREEDTLRQAQRWAHQAHAAPPGRCGRPAAACCWPPSPG